MTDRLYYRDAYLTEFEARVVDLADDGRRVYLDRSAFYPTSGGQPFDLGTIGGIEVRDVVDEEGRVAHLLAAPLAAPLDAAPGAAVRARVDWGRRFDHMQQHTGQHLLSAVLHDRFGWPTTSVHFGAGLNTLDVAAEQVPREALVEAEREANARVQENLRVVVSFEDAATAAGLRKPSDRPGELRIVTIEGLDRSACGGTHVRATGEIGLILLRRAERAKKGTRIEFTCGARAVARARADQEGLVRAARAFGAALDDVPVLVEAQAERLREEEAARRRLEGELAEARAPELVAAAEPDERGNRWVVERRAAGTLDELRTLAQAVTARERALFVGIVVSPPQVVFGGSEDSGIDAGRTLRAALAAVGGRGGGSSRAAQGSVPHAGVLEDVVAALRGAAGGGR